MSSFLQHLPWLRVTAVLVGWLGTGSHSPGEMVPVPSQSASIGSLHLSSGALIPAYRLAVVDVPPPPPELTTGLHEAAADLGAPAALPEPSDDSDTEALAPVRTCPLEVRAVVMAESKADSFAMVGTDEGSALVRRGSGVRAGGRLGSVAEIEDGVVVLRVG